ATRERQHVVVQVIDNGSGIPEEIRDRIFDPYFTTKPIGQGTGIGLDITQTLVRHNQGDISVDSRPGRTEFRVELPVAAQGGAPSGTSRFSSSWTTTHRCWRRFAATSARVIAISTRC